MAIVFEHITTLDELGIPLKDYPKNISGHIHGFKGLEKKFITDVPPDQQDPAKIKELKIKSAAIADAMVTYYESLKPETDMLKPAELARAKAVGLDENATIDQIVAADEKAKALAERAQAMGLPETATEEQVAAAEAAYQTERAEKLKQLGLPETATDEEIEAAVRAKITPKEQKHWLDELLDDYL